MKLRLLLMPALALAALCGRDLPADDPRMVDLNVVAVDAHGDPIADLTVDDFRVTDSGKPQTIAFFRRRASASAAPQGAPELGPNEFSNRTPANVPRATVVLLDLMNERFGTRGNAASRLVESLQSLDSAEYVYLYLLTLNGRLYPVHGLPGAEGEIHPPDGDIWTRHAKPLLDQALRTVAQVRPPDIEVDVAYRTQLTFVALDTLAAELATVPGHKSIVWLTDGVPIELGPNRSDTGDFVDFSPLLRRMSEGFDRSGVAIYPVRQIMLGSPANVDGSQYSGLNSLDTLDQFAQLTGGRPDAGKDIAAALRQAISDMRTSYQIGYYPPERNWDDKFHKLRVTCARKGVRVQAKTGYYAWREARGERSNEAMVAALSTRFDAAEIGLRASLSPGPQGGGAVHLDARIDAHDIVLARQGDGFNGELRLAVAGLGPETRPRAGPVVPMNLHFSAGEREHALENGIGFTQDVRPSEDTSALRLIVYDRGSNAVGSVTMPLPRKGN